jgi:Ca2+-binding EF-hand superfamily protein
MLYDTFKHFDLENKGYISTEDLKFSMQASGVEVSDEEIRRMMGEMQLAQSGMLNFDEFREMMLKDLSPVKTPYPRNFDTYSNAVISTVPMK